MPEERAVTDFERQVGKAIGLRWRYSEWAEREQWTVYPSFDHRTAPTRIVQAINVALNADGHYQPETGPCGCVVCEKGREAALAALRGEAHD